jgi:hypothetical protein
LRELPKVDGWSVDLRLREFRRVRQTKDGMIMDTVYFDEDTPRARRLTRAALEKLGRLEA